MTEKIQQNAPVITRLRVEHGRATRAQETLAARLEDALRESDGARAREAEAKAAAETLRQRLSSVAQDASD